jgi:hypothetical protein
VNALFKKLQYKGSDSIYVRNAPRELKPELAEMGKLTAVKSSPVCKQQYDFALFFVRSCAEIEKLAPKAAEKVPGDGVLWFAYPKKSSKRYPSDISRDDGWQPLGNLGYEGVRQVAINEDWSALRFRRADLIEHIKRD